MLYADYNYYANIYVGNLSDEAFKAQILKASKIIDRNINTTLTIEEFNRLSKEARDKLEYTTCALIDLLNDKEKSNNIRLSSYSIDGVTKNYRVISNDEYKARLKDCLLDLPDELTRFL